jgi:hypothetical protein
MSESAGFSNPVTPAPGQGHVSPVDTDVPSNEPIAYTDEKDDRDSIIADLRAELEKLTHRNRPETPASVPSPSTVEPVSPSEVEETDLSNVDLDRAVPEAQKNAAQRPLLTDAVDKNGNPTYPTNEDGTPNMREPGIHQNPVNYLHLDDGTVRKVAGAIPTLVGDAEGILHKVISAHPVLDEEGRQIVAGLIKEL